MAVTWELIEHSMMDVPKAEDLCVKDSLRTGLSEDRDARATFATPRPVVMRQMDRPRTALSPATTV